MNTLYAKFLGRDECRVIVVGLDGAGKSTIVYRLKHGKLNHDSQIIRKLDATPTHLNIHHSDFSPPPPSPPCLQILQQPLDSIANVSSTVR